MYLDMCASEAPCCFVLKENNRKKKSVVSKFSSEGKRKWEMDSIDELKVQELSIAMIILVMKSFPISK